MEYQEFKMTIKERVQEMVNHYVSMGKSPKTIRNHLYLISAVLKQAMNDNYIKRQAATPCAYVRLPKPSEVEGNAYTIEQVKVMLERAYQTQNRAMELLMDEMGKSAMIKKIAMGSSPIASIHKA